MTWLHEGADWQTHYKLEQVFKVETGKIAVMNSVV